MEERKIRVLVGKPGLDCHDRGAKLLCRELREAGMEVIYTGLYQTPETIVKAAIEEDVDIICLSILSGIHLSVSERIMELLKKERAEDIPLLCGGVIPERDIPTLKRLGVKEVTRPRVSIQDSVNLIKNLARGAKAEGRGTYCHCPS